MEIGNLDQYKLYHYYFQSHGKKQDIFYNKVLPVILFGLVGAFGWAIRGTSGWGGIPGGVVAGFWWSSLFYILAKIRGVDARWQFFALGFGIALGGLTGYGQFNSWIKGIFMTGPNETIEINPLWGFGWHFVVGVEWGGNAGGILSWTYKKTESVKEKLIRIGIPALCGVLGFFIIKYNPQLFFPAYSEDLYLLSECSSSEYCGRTMSTLPSLGVLIGVTIGFAIAEGILKNWEGLKVIGIMALGFGVAFPLGSLWFFGDLENFHSWWKLWEESIGLIGGISIGFVFLRFLKVVENRNNREKIAENGTINRKNANKDSNDSNNSGISKTKSESDQIMTMDKNQEQKIEWRKHVFFVLGLFLLYLYVLIGASSQLMEHFSFYTIQIEGEYEFAPEILTFFLIFGLTGIYGMIRNLIRAKKRLKEGQSLFPIKNPIAQFTKLSLFIAFCGIVAIFPAYMTLYYVVFLVLLLYLLCKAHEFYKSKNLIPDGFF